MIGQLKYKTEKNTSYADVINAYDASGYYTDIIGKIKLDVIPDTYTKFNFDCIMSEEEFDEINISGISLVLDLLIVNEPYRGMGIANKMMKYLFESFLPKYYPEIEIIVLQVSPLGDDFLGDEIRKSQKLKILYKFYKKWGFKKIIGNNQSIAMYKNI